MTVQGAISRLMLGQRIWQCDGLAKERDVSLTELINCVLADWSPTLGDPTVMGWVTVAGYLLATVLAVVVFVRQSGRQRVFWLGLSCLLLALAINKQLDLQSALTAAGRCLAKAQGWYDQRQAVQLQFILIIAGTSLVAACIIAWLMRRELIHIWLGLLGLTILLAFIVIRAAGFHHFDAFIGFQIGGIRMNWILELGGIAAISFNALHLLLRGRKGKN